MIEQMNYDAIKSYVSRIPQVFYIALFGELTAVFGPNYYMVRRHKNKVIYDFNSGTTGWCAALYATCKKLDMIWLYRKWKSLPWYNADTLDGEIEEKLSKILDSKDNTSGANCYYLHLLKQMDEEIDL